MKFALYIALSVQILYLNAQVSQSEKVQLDIINGQLYKYQGELKVGQEIDDNWMNYHLNKLRENTLRLLYNEHDTIQLSVEEKQEIISFFTNAENRVGSGNLLEIDLINNNEVIDFLRKNPENQVVFITRPLFLREDNLVVAFFANFCCGEINGPVNLSFYRTENDVWKRWIDISFGIF